MEEIRARMKERKINQTRLAEALGIDATAVSKMLAGKRGISAREAQIISNTLEISNVGYSPTRYLPVIGRVSAGAWREAIEEPIGMMPCPDDNLSKEAFVVIVDGTSMDKIVGDGGRVVIDPTDLDLVARRTYIVRNGNGDTTFKRFMTDPARLEPCSSDIAHKTIFPGRDTFEIVGRAVWRFEQM